MHVAAVPVTVATPAAATTPRAADAEFAHELADIRRRLQQTEAQLVEERNSHYELLKKVPLTLIG